LSYTDFIFSGLKITPVELNPGENVKVSLILKNTGSLAGAETIKLYLVDVDARGERPLKELRGFKKVFLEVPLQIPAPPPCRGALSYQVISQADTQIPYDRSSLSPSLP
jgi:hypothetical protein